MDYDKLKADLKAEAEEFAKGKTTDELAKWGFIHSYIANHMSTDLALVVATMREVLEERIESLRRLVWGVLIALVLGVIATMIAIILTRLIG